MELELYKEVVIINDLPEYDLRSGDIATLIDFIPHPEQGEEGAILEVFNDLNESIKVLTVPKSSIQVWQPLNNSQVIQEALSILIKHMEPQKFAQFVVACRLDKGDYIEIKEQLFKDETIDSLYEKIKIFEEEKMTLEDQRIVNP
jgi:hypothetical protein